MVSINFSNMAENSLKDEATLDEFMMQIERLKWHFKRLSIQDEETKKAYLAEKLDDRLLRELQRVEESPVRPSYDEVIEALMAVKAQRAMEQEKRERETKKN
ncbi:hypothetical protein PAPHI01_2744 [Pancytospora philotis]|nr:hypothetical protein PAPHI01_2744 [Pancytospora philotis]